MSSSVPQVGLGGRPMGSLRGGVALGASPHGWLLPGGGSATGRQGDRRRHVRVVGVLEVRQPAGRDLTRGTVLPAHALAPCFNGGAVGLSGRDPPISWASRASSPARESAVPGSAVGNVKMLLCSASARRRALSADRRFALDATASRASSWASWPRDGGHGRRSRSDG